MSRKIRVQFEIPAFSGWFRGLAGMALMLCAPVELGSETVTLTTYYPAPSGVYTRMITTANTFLARDGGVLGVGTTGAVSKLGVSGGAAIGAAYATIAAPANGLIVEGTAGFGLSNPTAGNAVHVNGTSRFDGIIDARGNLVMSGFSAAAGRQGYIYVSNANTGCTQVTISALQNPACGFNNYVTYTKGIWVEGTSFQNLTVAADLVLSIENVAYCCPK